MRSSALFGALVATAACSLLVHGLPRACICGNLGSGTNPCTCSETVVKAAKLPKPTFYVSPEEINDAAAARNGIVVPPSSSSPNGFTNLPSTGNSNPIIYANNAEANANANANAYANGNADTITYSGAGSNLYTNDDSSAYNDGRSVAYSNDGVIAYSNGNGNSDTITISNSNPSITQTAITTSDSLVKIDSGCGCSKQITKSLDLDDSTDSNVNIVPSFAPIGDLCYPLPIDSRSGKLIEKTRVTPAYPGKIVCNTCNPAAPYEICINTHSGETTARMLSVETIGSNSASFGTPSTGSPLPMGNTDTFGVSGSESGTLVNSNSGSFDGSSSAISGVFSGTSAQTGSFENIRSGTTTFGGSVSGAFGASRSGLFGNVNSGAIGGFQFGKYSSSNSGAFDRSSSSSNFRAYSVPSFAYSGPSTSTVQTSNGQNQYGRTIVSSGSSSNCFDDDDDDDFGNDNAGEGPVDYSYPQIPADAVSLTLAYKNLRAPNVIYRQGKQFVPEDKLSFGHRTVPNDAKKEKKIAEIPEERLVTVDKPVVELKVAPPRTVVIGSYDEREEAKLAELEAIERESITQEEAVDRVAEGLLTYKDLGYAPVGSIYANSRSYSSGIINGDIDDSMEKPCGPLGPPIPDYIPGSVIVQQQITQDNFPNSAIGEISDKRPGSCAN